MAVCRSLLAIYSGVGISALIAFSLADLINPLDIDWMFLFFLTGYGMIASLMASAGAAVNDLREAQTFMTPIMMFMMIPYLMMLVIPRAPNSTLAVVLSFIPPINPFIMMLRIASNDPPPLWQIVLALLVSIAGAVIAIWLAGKIFRVGMLMFGKPPDFRTLIRWVRMACARPQPSNRRPKLSTRSVCSARPTWSISCALSTAANQDGLEKTLLVQARSAETGSHSATTTNHGASIVKRPHYLDATTSTASTRASAMSVTRAHPPTPSGSATSPLAITMIAPA